MNHFKILYLCIALLAIWLLVLTSGQTAPASKEHSSVIHNEVIGFSTDLTKMADKLAENVITVESDSGLSSGFFYRREGGKSYFITAYHGLDNGNITVHFANDYHVSATLKAFDIYADIAVLEVEFPYVLSDTSFGDTALLHKGEFVLSIGTPLSLDYQGSIALGIIGNKERNIRNQIFSDGRNYTYFLNVGQLSSTLQKGYSGGPVYNMAGQVVGMNVFAYDEGGISFFVLSEEIQLIAEKALKGEEIHKTNFGFSSSDIATMENYEKAAKGIPLTVNEGVYVSEVLPETIASVAGVRQGDILLGINAHILLSQKDILAAQYEENSLVNFRIDRSGELLNLSNRKAENR